MHGLSSGNRDQITLANTKVILVTGSSNVTLSWVCLTQLMELTFYRRGAGPQGAFVKITQRVPAGWTQLTSAELVRQTSPSATWVMASSWEVWALPGNSA